MIDEGPPSADPGTPGSIPTNTPTEALVQPYVPAAWEQPERIGAYRILEQLGEGGMGVVYLAEQTEPVKRRVALKIIKPGMDSHQVVARFEAERQAMAQLNHPGVAKVFEAGATERGLPYFVMEYVQGSPITEHCDQQRLSIEERIKLFMDVCDAIQHAHQRGIIHRDLKPSNILVGYADNETFVKVIDFGIAKAIDRELTERTLFTHHGVLIGTPEYMSPEQAEGSTQGVDTRTDVYALGVILYELLTGTLPFTSRELRSAGLAEIQRHIREIAPPKPSTRLGLISKESPETGQTTTRSRRTDAKSLNRRLRSDLDWVVMKCLEKDRGRRYDSSSALALDLARYLNHEPVTACRPSATYRLRKSFRRHRVFATAVGAVGVALILGLAGTGWQWWRAEGERSRAQESETQALELAGELVGAFNERVAPLAGAMALREDLARLGIEHLNRLEARSVEADVDLLAIADGFDKVGDAQAGRGLPSKGDLAAAEASYLQARDLRQAQFDAGRTEARTGLAQSAHRLAILRRDQERQAEAITLIKESQSLLDAAPDSERGGDWLLARGQLLSVLASIRAQQGTPTSRLEAVVLGEKAVDAFASAGMLRDTEEASAGRARAQRTVAETQWWRARWDEMDDADREQLRELALEGLRRSGETTRELLSAQPAHVGYRADLAGNLQFQAILLRLLERTDEAGDAGGQAAKLLEWLLEAEPQSNETRLSLANAYELLALIARRHDADPHAALWHAKRGLELCDQLVASQPGNPEYHRALIGHLEQGARAASAADAPGQLLSLSERMYEQADRWDASHPGDFNWTARRITMAAQLVLAGLGSSHTPEARRTASGIALNDRIDTTLTRWTVADGYSSHAASLRATRKAVAELHNSRTISE